MPTYAEIKEMQEYNKRKLNIQSALKNQVNERAEQKLEEKWIKQGYERGAYWAFNTETRQGKGFQDKKARDEFIKQQNKNIKEEAEQLDEQTKPIPGKTYTLQVKVKLTNQQAKKLNEVEATMDDVAEFLGDSYTIDEVVDSIWNS